MPSPEVQTLDQWMDDVEAVLDAEGSERAAILGDTEGGPTAILFAATFPERVSSLVLVNSFARWRRADDYPIGMPDSAYENLLTLYQKYFGQDADIPVRAGDAVCDHPRRLRGLSGVRGRPHRPALHRQLRTPTSTSCGKSPSWRDTSIGLPLSPGLSVSTSGPCIGSLRPCAVARSPDPRPIEDGVVVDVDLVS